ncbi:hypothetical protein AB9P05_20275 [Roseivirga sp. BDSF3-8]|uniref:hypothetical protein n=1 Tax=Roseivirga sp. BDSF3-8 TaxID=3241598 RepID=UPI003531F7B6
MKKLAGVVLLLFMALSPVYSFSTLSATDSVLAEMYADDLDNIEVSYFGFTENKNEYNLYAFKGKKRYWYFVVSDGKSIHSFYKRKKKGELLAGSFLATQSLLALVQESEIKKKEKRKKVNDLNLYCFYKFRKDGRKLMKGVRKVEEENSGSWVFKVLSAPFKPIISLFQSKDKKEEIKEELMKKKLEKLEEKQAELSEKVAKSIFP